MEKKRWSLIFIGLCLIFAFSMSPVEAQEVERQCKDGLDNDGDGKFDCDDPDCESKGFCKGEDPEPAGTIEICHFSPNGLHCEGEGGLPRTIQNTLKAITQHNLHGDCSEADTIPEGEFGFCPGHCICDPPPPPGEGTILFLEE